MRSLALFFSKDGNGNYDINTTLKPDAHTEDDQRAKVYRQAGQVQLEVLLIRDSW